MLKIALISDMPLMNMIKPVWSILDLDKYKNELKKKKSYGHKIFLNFENEAV